MNMRRLTAASVFWTVFQNASRRLMTLVVFLVMARLLEPKDFGLVALAGSAVAFIELFVRIGFAEAIVQREKLEDGHLDTAFWVTVGIGTGLALLAFLLASPVSRWFDSPDMMPVMRWLSLTILLLSLSRVQAAILRRQFRFKELAKRTLIASICGGVVGLAMAFNGMGVWALVAQQLVESTVSLIVLWASSSWRPGLKVSEAHFRDLFGFGISLMGVQAMHFMNQHSGKLIIGFFLGPVAVGLYAIGQRLVLVVQQLSSMTFQTAMFSTFARMQSDIGRLQTTFLTSTRLVVLIVFPIYLFLSIAGPETVVLVFGKQWASSGVIIQYLAFAGLIGSVNIFHDSVFRAAGKPDFSLRVAVVSSLLGVVLILLAVKYGIEAVAFVAIVRTIVVLPYSFYLINRIFPLGMTLVIRQMRAPLIGSVALVLAIVIMRRTFESWSAELVGFLAIALVGFCCYGASIWLVDRKLVMEAWDAGKLVVARGGKKSKVKGQATDPLD